MNRDEIMTELGAHEQELRAAGVRSLSLVGSIARGEHRTDSDIDVLVRLAPEIMDTGFAYFGRIDALIRRLEAILKRPVDVIVEPVRKERLRRAIDRDRRLAFRQSAPSSRRCGRKHRPYPSVYGELHIRPLCRRSEMSGRGGALLLRVSEAGRKLQGILEELIPDQPWPDIRAMGNVLRHEYDTVNLQVIWHVVENDLGSLRRSVEVVIATLQQKNTE